MPGPWLLSTTGAHHVKSADGCEELGESRFLGLVTPEAGRGAQDFIKRVEAMLVRFHGGSLGGQDVTLLTLGRPAR